jgi:hypothetical protein
MDRWRRLARLLVRWLEEYARTYGSADWAEMLYDDTDFH